MRSPMAMTIAALALVALWACSDASQVPGGGTGGIVSGAGGSGGVGGGSGGQGGAGDAAWRAQVCASLCDALVACGTEDPGCAEACVGPGTPTELYVPCATCLEEQSCRGAPLACMGSGTCDPAWDLRVTGAGLDDFEGAPAQILVVEAVEGELWVDFARTATVVGGGLDVWLQGALPFWKVPFDVVVLIDANRDGRCTAGEDGAWRLPIGVPASDAHLHVEGDDLQAPDACAFWDEAEPQIVLEASGYETWEGAWVLAASVWSGDTFLTASAFSTAPVQDGAFRLELGKIGDFVEEMAPGTAIEAVWMIDVDGDWICTDADVGGHAPIPPLRGFEQRVETRGAEVGSAPCHLLRGLGHDVHLEGGGWDSWEDTAYQVVLLQEGVVVARRQGRVEGGIVSAAFERMGTHGATYQAAIWLDGDGDGSCALPGDGVWSLEVGLVEADVQVELPQQEGEPEAAMCTHFDLRRLLD